MLGSNAEVFQNIMFHLFQDMEGVEATVDDLVEWGEHVEQHDTSAGPLSGVQP